MNPTIINIKEKKVVGMKSTMLRHEYGNIITLWKRFMPQKKMITNTINSELIALQDYGGLMSFEKPFDIWAFTEVSDFDNIPNDMMPYTIPEGMYAVFLHKGMDTGAAYQHIMTEWLPNSAYTIDDRPHFQVMGAKYKNGSPDSEEDFYVPLKLKS